MEQSEVSSSTRSWARSRSRTSSPRWRQVRAGLVAHLPERRPRQPELGRDRTARRPSSCSGSSRSLESKRVLDLPPGVGGMPKAAGVAGAAGGLADEARRHARRALPAAHGAVGGEEVRLRRRQVRPRADGLDHRRPLPRAGPHAGAQRTDRARVPAVGDVRHAVSEGQVQDLRGRGRHRRHVLHLQVAEEPTASSIRATRSRSACRSSRRTSRWRTSRTTTSTTSQIHAKQENKFQYPDAELEKLLDPKIKAFFIVNPGNPYAVAISPADDREDRRRPQEAARSDPADRRRLRHVRAGLPLADGRVPEEHHRRLLLQQVLRLHRLAPGDDRRPRGQHLRRDDRRPSRERSRSCWTSATAGSRSSRASSPSSTASSPTAATSR